MKKSIFIFAILLTISAPLVAETKIILSPSLMYFDYTEFDTSNKKLDRELGWLPGLDAKLIHNLSPNWFISAHTSFFRWDVDYVGQSQAGTPHRTTTNNNIFRIGGSIGNNIYRNTRLLLSVLSHRWIRSIQNNNNISGLDETYKWLEYSIGFNVDIIKQKNDTVSLSAAYLKTKNADIYVDLTRVNLGTAELDLGESTGTRFDITWKRKLTETARLGINLLFETWEFGRSNTKLTQGGSSQVLVTEPRSETQNVQLQLNIEYNF